MSEAYWIPTAEERKYVNLIASMAIDTLVGKGVADKGTFIANLKTMIRLMLEIQESALAAKDGQ